MGILKVLKKKIIIIKINNDVAKTKLLWSSELVQEGQNA